MTEEEAPPPADENQCAPYCWCTREGGHHAAAMRWLPTDPVLRFPARATQEAA